MVCRIHGDQKISKKLECQFLKFDILFLGNHCSDLKNSKAIAFCITRTWSMCLWIMRKNEIWLKFHNLKFFKNWFSLNCLFFDGFDAEMTPNGTRWNFITIAMEYLCWKTRTHSKFLKFQFFHYKTNFVTVAISNSRL